MALNLSPAQKEIVELRDCNILVSAAAGSGKTRVLVERIISRIMDEKDPVDIDRILVLTFTNAAAAEMRGRITEAIMKLAREKGAGEHIKRQTALIHNAEITTIDSFCLGILKNNFAEIGLEPGFRIVNENEIKSVADEVLDEVLEEALADPDVECRREFFDRFESKDNLKKIRKSIEDTYKEADKAPFFNDYIEERRCDYNVQDEDELGLSGWVSELVSDIEERISDAGKALASLREQCMTEGPGEYLRICDSDEKIIDRLKGAKDIKELWSCLGEDISWDRLPARTDCEQEVKERAKELRELYKDLINDIKKDFFQIPPKVQAEHMRDTEKAVNGLLGLVKRYKEKLDEEKRKRGILTFSDIEHLALEILLVKDNTGYVPSRVALDYRKSYKELMIDEYQDSNHIQEWLIHSISGEDDGVYDRFMVGDVKQSIYRFRNADPTLFMEKYEQYQKGGRPLRRVDLSVNYRSRKQVLDTVNAVFKKVMDRNIGGVDYDEDNRLNYGGLYEDKYGSESPDVYKSELLLLQKDTVSSLSKEEQEARLIADRIKGLIKEQPIYDSDTGRSRPCRFSDIVILMRAIPANIDDVRRIYEEEGIPVHLTSKGGYFDAHEIVTVLNYLSILDNPLNDIAFYGTLVSIFAGLSEEEAALLKLSGEKSIYHSFKRVCDESEAFNDLKRIDGNIYQALREKCLLFNERYTHYRNKIPYTPVYRLLREILKDSDYINLISAFPGGEQKKANVLALLSKAEGYKKAGFTGIFDFCKYIERLHKYESDEGEVMTLSEDSDVVRIMTMHKSKGLEFPVCILSGLGRKFNMSDSKDEVIFSHELGLGLDHVDTLRRIKTLDIRKKFIASRIRREAVSEELRVLYVAMTRAKEKLVMVATVDDIDKATADYPYDPMSISGRLSIGSFYEVLRRTRGDNDWDGQCSEIVFTPDKMGKKELASNLQAGRKREELTEILTELSEHDMRIADEIKIKLLAKYPHKELEGLYTKTSVSELKMASIHDALIKEEALDLPAEFFGLHEEEEYIPSFVTKREEKITGARVGSAYHRVMELLDLSLETVMWSKDKIDDSMNIHIESGRILREEYDLVDKDKVVGFLNSDIGKRVCRAAARGKLYKEKPFVLGIAANRLNEGFPEEETVLIQGIIDVYFEEDGKLVLLDYKTDRIKSEEELINRYMTQLDYYEEALARITGMPVVKRVLYSFALEKAVEC